MIDHAYAEQLVKRQPPSCWMFVKAGMILLFLLSLLLVMFIPFGIVLPAALGVGIWFVFQNGKIEYEYLYIDRQLMVDKITAGARRRRIAEYSMEDVEIAAPEKSPRVKECDAKVRKTADYSSGTGREKTYALIHTKNGICTKIIIEPDERMRKLMKQTLPGKYTES